MCNAASENVVRCDSTWILEDFFLKINMPTLNSIKAAGTATIQNVFTIELGVCVEQLICLVCRLTLNLCSF